MTIKFCKYSPPGFWEKIISFNKSKKNSNIEFINTNIKHEINENKTNTNNKEKIRTKDKEKINVSEKIQKVYKDIMSILQKYIKINKKEKINDYECIYLIAYKLINGSSYQDLTDDLYCLFDINLGNDQISNKFNSLSSSLLQKLNNELVEYIKKTFKPLHELNDNIKIIDGSDLCANISLSKYGYDTTNTKTYSTPYSSFLTNYNYELIENIDILKKYNERKSSNRLILQQNERKNIYLEDAGYFSHNHAKFINDSGNYFIIRLPTDGLLIKSIKYKFIKTNEIDYYSSGNKYKIIKYNQKNIKNNTDIEYYIITNKLDLTLEEIKSYYHFRWDVEVKINIFKNKLGGSFYNVKKEVGLYNSIYIQHFVFLLSYIFSRLSEDIFGDTYTINKKIDIDKTKKENTNVSKKDFKKINNNSSIRITVNLLLPLFFSNNYNEERINNCLKRIHSNKVESILGRTFIHKPTKKDIIDKNKEKLRIHTKDNVKKLYDIDIYHNLNLNCLIKDQLILRFE